MMASFNLSDDQIKSMMSTAILQAIGPEQRDKLLSDAIATLIEPKGKDSWSRTTPIQDAFSMAAATVANRMCREMLEEDEVFRGKIKAIICDAFEKAMQKRDDLVDKIAFAIGDLLSGSK